MKKMLSVFSLVLALVLVLSACASGSSPAASSGTQKKTLRVVDDATYAPFEYMSNGKIVGFDVDILNALSKETGYKVQLVNVGWDPLFVELKNKTADMSISAITINSQRKQTYDFSVPYFLSTNKILVKKNSSIKSAADLKGKVIAVQTATTGQAAVEKIVGQNNPNVKKFKTINLAIMELLNGGASAVVADNTVIEEYAKNNPGQNLKVIADKKAFAPEFYGLMYPKGSKLRPVFDKAVNTLYANGTYEKIYKKWFKASPDINELKAQQK
ncbi:MULTISPECIES: basic amino acid ABC transporter substrate-binding protein [unclassified Sporolactobacillus]|uniref:basic amino acid ABC transporter substrate-binding protein n=1 Tax=unclassified Sporolactobacillus TaxID=2628533 RepID=UPI002368A4E8|nr:basic amino acid ABC transporter substrate-binding protein [Sporolactobacillus sp. CQH2019]MDD9149902.1 basic amino acid ABC transporter substrate-binding protein [Sporolactobacillus sp. CQH2019]